MHPTPGLPKAVVAFDDIVIKGKLQPFLELTRAFAGASLIEQVHAFNILPFSPEKSDVRNQVALLEKVFTELRSLILAASSCQKPDQQVLGDFLTPLQGYLEAVTRLKEASRKDREWFTHLSTVAEGAPCVGWVTVVSIFQARL